VEGNRGKAFVPSPAVALGLLVTAVPIALVVWALAS